MIYGPIFVADLDKDFELVEQIFDHDYADRWKPGRGARLLARAAAARCSARCARWAA